MASVVLIEFLSECATKAACGCRGAPTSCGQHEQNTEHGSGRAQHGSQCCECPLTEFMSELPSFDFEPERFECENDDIIFRDGCGRKVMFAAALQELDAHWKLLHLAQGRKGRSSFHDLYAAQVMFNVEKRRLVEVYLERYTADVLDQDDLAQRITDVIATRTRLDLEANHFTAAFFGLRSLLRHQIRADRTVSTGGCRQATKFTSAESCGFICTLDQTCLIEPGTPS